MPKVSRQNAVFHQREGVSAFYYQFPEINEGTTVAFAEFTGEHGERTIEERSRIYYILDGEAEFVINGEKFSAVAGDTIAIPSGGTYNLWPKKGMIKVLLFMELLDTTKLPK